MKNNRSSFVQLNTNKGSFDTPVLVEKFWNAIDFEKSELVYEHSNEKADASSLEISFLSNKYDVINLVSKAKEDIFDY